MEEARKSKVDSGAPGRGGVDGGSEAVESGAVLVEPVGVDLLELAGADRVDFLHGQVSNDVRGLATGGTTGALLLDHRGHALAGMAIVREEQRLLVVVEGGARSTVEGSLRSHIVFDQVELRQVEDAAVLTVQGPRTRFVVAEALGEAALPPAAGSVRIELDGESLLAYPARRSGPGGIDFIAARSLLTTVGDRLLAAGAHTADPQALDASRVAAGVATAAGEGGAGVLPQEAGLDHLVSYRKGCYLGQEIMARIEARGNLRRGLAGLKLAQWPPGDTEQVTLAGRNVGRLGTVVRHHRHGVIALAVLRRDLPAAAPLEVGGVEARACALPFDAGLA